MSAPEGCLRPKAVCARRLFAPEGWLRPKAVCARRLRCPKAVCARRLSVPEGWLRPKADGLSGGEKAERGAIGHQMHRGPSGARPHQWAKEGVAVQVLEAAQSNRARAGSKRLVDHTRVAWGARGCAGAGLCRPVRAPVLCCAV